MNQIVARPIRTGTSSGQRVMISILLRVAFAKAFKTNILTLCLDEPTNFLDQDNTEKLARMLSQFIEENDLQVNVITHSENFVDKLVAYSREFKKFRVAAGNGGSAIMEIEE